MTGNLRKLIERSGEESEHALQLATEASERSSDNIQGLSALCEDTSEQSAKLYKNAVSLAELSEALADDMEELEA